MYVCMYVQEQRVGKQPRLHRQEYVLMLFLRDFILGSADRSSFQDAFGKSYEVVEVTVI